MDPLTIPPIETSIASISMNKSRVERAIEASQQLPETPSDPASRDDFLAVYRWMLFARIADERMANLYRAGKIAGGVYLGIGQEAISGTLGYYLKKGTDIFAPLIRDTAGRLAFGEELLDMTRTYLGSVLGPMRGRDGNIHRGRPREGLVAMISHLGASISFVAGSLFARRLQGRLGDSVAGAFIGDGGTSTGAFHEAANLIGVERLPVVLVVVNNQYAYSTPVERQYACNSLVDRAVGYGFKGYSVNGTQLDECLSVVKEAVYQARMGSGPQMIVADLLRLCGHGVHDDATYIDPNLRSMPFGGDCLIQATETLLSRGWATQDEIDQWRLDFANEMEQAVSQTLNEPAPDPETEHWTAYATPELQG